MKKSNIVGVDNPQLLLVMCAGRGMIARPFNALPYSLTPKNFSFFLLLLIFIFFSILRASSCCFIINRGGQKTRIRGTAAFSIRTWFSYLMKVDKRVICQRSKIVNRDQFWSEFYWHVASFSFFFFFFLRNWLKDWLLWTPSANTQTPDASSP